MQVDKGKSKTPDDKSQDFVPAVFAKDAQEAETFSELLKDHDIPAICGHGDTKDPAKGPVAAVAGMTHGVPVLVPEELLDEASEVIADRENTPEFCLDDDDEEDEEEEDDLDYQEELDPELPDEFEDEDEDTLLDDQDLDEEEDEG